MSFFWKHESTSSKARSNLLLSLAHGSTVQNIFSLLSCIVIAEILWNSQSISSAGREGWIVGEMGNVKKAIRRLPMCLRVRMSRSLMMDGMCWRAAWWTVRLHMAALSPSPSISFPYTLLPSFLLHLLRSKHVMLPLLTLISYSFIFSPFPLSNLAAPLPCSLTFSLVAGADSSFKMSGILFINSVHHVGDLFYHSVHHHSSL